MAIYSHGIECYARGGMRWDIALNERLENPVYLESYGYKIYSQNDEDGIINEVFSRIGTTNKIFVEFGVQNGIECNSHNLLLNDWRGLWIEGQKKYYKQVNYFFSEAIKPGQLKVINAFVNKENINDLIASSGINGEIDLLSIDVDGNDYYILEAIKNIIPRAIVIEYNSLFAPEQKWIMPYDSGYKWKGGAYYGASLCALCELCNKKGYQLVGTNITGCNAFFVRKDLVKDLFPAPATPDNLYNPLRRNYKLLAPGHKTLCYMNQSPDFNRKIYKKYNSKLRLLTGLPRALFTRGVRFIRENHKKYRY